MKSSKRGARPCSGPSRQRRGNRPKGRRRQRELEAAHSTLVLDGRKTPPNAISIQPCCTENTFPKAANPARCCRNRRAGSSEIASPQKRFTGQDSGGTHAYDRTFHRRPWGWGHVGAT